MGLGVKSVTSLDQRRKKSGKMIMMEQNVTQKTTLDRLNTLRSPEERTTTHCVKKSFQTKGLVFIFLPRGVKRTVEATRKPRIRPTTTTQAMTDPKRHQLIIRIAPPTTPMSADRVRRTAERQKEHQGGETKQC